MRILTRNVPALKHLRRAVEKLFQDTNFCAKDPLRLRKSQLHPMGTSGINEATADGVSNVLDDLVGQMDLDKLIFESTLIPVGGDQLSVDRTRKATYYLEQESTLYAKKELGSSSASALAHGMGLLESSGTNALL